MMARDVFKLDTKGVEEILKGADMKDAVRDAAERVAQNVRAQNITVGDREGGRHEIALPVTVETDTTDRARASVVLKHPAGLAVQAKHGALSKAASAAGLEVTTDE